MTILLTENEFTVLVGPVGENSERFVLLERQGQTIGGHQPKRNDCAAPSHEDSQPFRRSLL